eukprot:CAMPEP_0181033366 /NCGR_PEP_ID=MMETSP1070-20121207/7219_1 /TAXON_ID=265543 /ORGANISM="Minutocellus polymorphus, Strain NH13" /LENGTH=1006 /DNA_ID=CAMNT_0023110789 /DNA_START=150 /DNA_END=3170 /DNA_ORIENTATION=-
MNQKVQREVSRNSSSCHGAEDGESRRPAAVTASPLNLGTNADNDSAFEEPLPSLPSPMQTDTGESETLSFVRSVSDIAGAISQTSSRAGTSVSDESLRSASSSVLERLRNNDNSLGGDNSGRSSRTNSSELWKKRRKLKRQNPPTFTGACGDGDSGVGEPHDLSLPDNASTSVTSSASMSSSDEGRKQPQHGRKPNSASSTNNGLPPAPPRSARRTPTPIAQIPRGGGNVARSRSNSPALLASGPARLNRGVSLFEMKRRPSANMTSEDLRAIHNETEPIAFFSDTFDADDAEFMGREEEDELKIKSVLPKASMAVTKLTKVPYVHGAYSAVAPIFIRDARWMAILRKLMPESHAGVATLVKKNATKIDPLRLMKWAENNPVVASYGALNSDNGGPHYHVDRTVGTASPSPKPALEWDVFLDPSLVRSVDKAMQAAEDLNKSTSGKGGDISFDDYNAQIAADVEVDRQISRLMSRMMLAHGSTTQLVTEAVGMASRYNFARVVEQGESRRRKSKWGSILEPDCITSADKVVEMASAEESSISPSKAYEADVAKAGRGSKTISASGIFVERWLILFCQALKLGLDIASKDSQALRSRLSALSPESSCNPLSENSRASSSSSLQSDEEENDDAADDDGQGSVDSFVVEADGNIADPLSMCGIFLCLGLEDKNARKADHSSSTMASSAKRIHKLLGTPLRVVLDLKSRKVPPRVWARLLDTLRTRGIAVDGIGSFDIDELRSIASFTCTPISQVIFLHSAGDLQRACHAGEIKRGDTVFFNAGSLIWKRPTLCEATGLGLCADSTSLNRIESQDMASSGHHNRIDPWNQNGLKMGAYSFQPFAYPREKLELLDDVVEECKATLEDYQRHLELNIGLYVQEFSVGDAALDAISKLVNHYPSIYNLGLAWGGLNGSTVKGVHGDGYWNQRYIGREWDRTAEPEEHMQILAPEDHHLFQKALHAGDWGQALTVNQVGIDEEHHHRGLNGLQGLHIPPLCKNSGAPFAVHFHN